MTQSQQSYEQLLAKVEEIMAGEARRSKKYSQEDAAKEVRFLRAWSQGRPIVRHDEKQTFWLCGKFITKLDFGLVEMIVKCHPDCQLFGNAKQGGAVLVVPKPKV
jgi:hypothetical protein